MLQTDFCLADWTIQKCYVEEILPIIPCTAATKRIEWQIPAVPAFTDLSQTTLSFLVKLTLANGDPIPAQIEPDQEKGVKGYYGCGLDQLPVATLFRGLFYVS